MLMKRIETTKIEFDTNKKEIGRFLFKITHTDSDYNILSETEFDSNKTVISRQNSTFTPFGEILERSIINVDNDLTEIETFSYDSNNELTRITLEYGDGCQIIKDVVDCEFGYTTKIKLTNEHGDIIGFKYFRYDENGRIVEEKDVDFEENEDNRIEKEYSNDGLLVSEKLFYQSNLEYAISFKYNASSLVEDIIKKNDDNFVVEHEKIEYNTAGEILKSTKKNYYQGYEEINLYEYDSNSNMINLKQYSNGQLVFENNCTYDSENNRISEEIMELDSYGLVYRHEKLLHNIIG